MERKECINFLQERLKKYGASIYNYRGQEFIAIANGNSDNHMAFTFGEEEFAMEFTYQTARFKYGNEEDCAMHAEKFLTEKLCAVEIFLSGKPLFGGSRETDGCNFKTVEEFAIFYAGGNEKIAENLLGFMKNGGVTVKIFSWANTYNRSFEIVADGDELTIKE
ncbi:MAG: hypothetical protein IKA61_07140 [Clostridia bacterium]|nr:hypothetical protein [Clostridia bacterium]